jgi:hypothetical protein
MRRQRKHNNLHTNLQVNFGYIVSGCKIVSYVETASEILHTTL